MSTSGDILSKHEKLDTMIHVGKIQKYTGGCSVHGRDFMSTSWSLTMNKLMDIMMHIRDAHHEHPGDAWYIKGKS